MHQPLIVNGFIKYSINKTFPQLLFSDTIRDDLKEIKGEIGSISEKLETLKAPAATKDEGQFPKSCIPYKVL